MTTSINQSLPLYFTTVLSTHSRTFLWARLRVLHLMYLSMNSCTFPLTTSKTGVRCQALNSSQYLKLGDCLVFIHCDFVLHGAEVHGVFDDHGVAWRDGVRHGEGEKTMSVFPVETQAAKEKARDKWRRAELRDATVCQRIRADRRRTVAIRVTRPDLCRRRRKCSRSCWRGVLSFSGTG